MDVSFGSHAFQLNTTFVTGMDKISILKRGDI